MAGFPFPDGEASNREQSWDSGTPFSSGGDILIDPALSEVPLDPALMAEEGVPGSSEVRVYKSGLKEALPSARREVVKRVASRSCSRFLCAWRPSLTYCRDSYPSRPRSTRIIISHASKNTFKVLEGIPLPNLLHCTSLTKNRYPCRLSRSKRRNAHRRGVNVVMFAKGMR